MTKDELTTLYDDARDSICRHEFRSAFDSMRRMGNATRALELLSELDTLEQRYFYMLRFISEGNTVPNIEAELDNIGQTADELCHKLYIECRAVDDNALYFSQIRYQKLRPEETLGSLVSDYLSEHERLRTDAASLTDSRRQATRERLAVDIFNRLWVEYPLAEETAALLESLLLDNDIPEHDRILWLGATGLGALFYPDKGRTDLLLGIHAQGAENLSAIAAIWLVLAGEAASRTNTELTSDHTAKAIDLSQPNDLADIYLELYRANGTEAMSSDMRNTIMPGMMDMGRKLADQLGKDPESIAEQIGVDGFDAIKGFMEAQANGDDVYMDTLGHMRQFPFFHNVANWFLPFHTSHSELADVTDGEGAAIAEAIDRMPMFCDSDKYALILSIGMAPKAMQAQMFSAMTSNNAMMPGSEEFDNAMEGMRRKGRRAIINNYVRNIYRFFRLFRRKNEFPVIFDPKGQFHNFPATTLAENHHEGLKAIGELLMRQKNYDAAYLVYSLLIDYDPENADYWLNRGISINTDYGISIASANFEQALELRPGHLPTIKLLAKLYINDDEYEQAESLLAPAAASHPDDLELLRMLADAYYGNSKNAKALEICYNIAYIAPDDTSIKPLMAWLLTVTGDFDAAEMTFADFISESKSSQDIIRYGHMLWAAGRTNEALDAYSRAERSADLKSAEDFRMQFQESLNDEVCAVMSPDRFSALYTVPDILAFRNFGSRLGQI
jgi:tetratricopeptide (TPR) repeat protein